MESTTAVQETKAKSEGSTAASQNFVERRRRRRAKISAQLHVRTVNTPETVEEVCMTVDVSRDGLLFMANRSYWKGQALQIAFPFSTDAGAINQAQPAEVVRVMETGGGKFAVAVQFEAAAVQAKDAGKSGAFSVGSGVAASQTKQQQMVLAVESDTRTAEIMRNLLQQDGYNVVLVSTAQEALDILRSEVPAVFIAEVEAQDMSGHDLCLIIKRSERLQRVPVILLTRAAQPADYTASHQLGAVVCMAKPFQPERLLHVVRLVAPPASIKTVYGASRTMSNAIERTL